MIEIAAKLAIVVAAAAVTETITATAINPLPLICNVTKKQPSTMLTETCPI